MIAVLVLLVVMTIVPAIVLALLGGRIFSDHQVETAAAHARSADARNMSGQSTVRRTTGARTTDRTTLV